MVIPVTRSDLLSVCERLRGINGLVAGGLIDQHLPPEHEAWAYAERALGYVAARSQDDMATELEAFAMLSIDFLRLQARFMKTRRYASQGGGADLVESLYNDEAKMKGYYLDGLALSYALWPNNARRLRFLIEGFLPRLPAHPRVVEVGAGHGLLGALMLDARPDLDYLAVDISPSALVYTEEALLGAGVDASRVTVAQADAMSGDLDELSGGKGFAGLVCCEVLEHVNHPERMLTGFATALRPGGSAFVSTVANVEFEDHVYLYNDADEIRAMVHETGWQAEDELVEALPGCEAWDPLPVNYSAVLVRTP